MRYFSAVFFLLFSYPAFSWEGYDQDSGAYIEIEDENLVRIDEEIEIYDSDLGRYRNVEVKDVTRIGNSIELEVTDLETGDAHTLVMD